MIEELLPGDLLRYRRDKLVIWIQELRKGSKDPDKPAAVKGRRTTFSLLRPGSASYCEQCVAWMENQCQNRVIAILSFAGMRALASHPIGRAAVSMRDESSLYSDAASWHISRDLALHVKRRNDEALAERYPVVKTAPLPAGAQFLNVIESVFSGMARAIIHNSDYCSPEAAKDAIDRYYAERNEYFQTHPKRAGHKIWGQERVQCEFHESNNCKDPLYCW